MLLYRVLDNYLMTVDSIHITYTETTVIVVLCKESSIITLTENTFEVTIQVKNKAKEIYKEIKDKNKSGFVLIREINDSICEYLPACVDKTRKRKVVRTLYRKVPLTAGSLIIKPFEKGYELSYRMGSVNLRLYDAVKNDKKAYGYSLYVHGSLIEQRVSTVLDPLISRLKDLNLYSKKNKVSKVGNVYKTILKDGIEYHIQEAEASEKGIKLITDKGVYTLHTKWLVREPLRTYTDILNKLLVKNNTIIAYDKLVNRKEDYVFNLIK